MYNVNLLLFFSLEKLRGPEGGPGGEAERGPERGIQVLSTPSHNIEVVEK